MGAQEPFWLKKFGSCKLKSQGSIIAESLPIMSKILASVKSGVETFVQKATGNEEYHLGDYSKAGLSKAKSGVETVVQRATGNEEYQFGDYSKAAFSKAKSGVETLICRATGTEESADSTK